jgi:hypothetical protein
VRRVSRRTASVLATLAGFVLAAGLGGCIFGGGGPDDAVQDFASAIGDEDFDKACDYLAEDIQAQAEAAGGCAAALEGSLSDEDIEGADSVETEVVEESDDTATVEATFEGEDPEELEVTKEDGDWKISGLP